MVGKTNVGGVKMFAAIGVTYPEGSSCTCTNGTKTLTAKSTAGQWVFAVPEAGTWTVTATDGTNTKSQSVSITAEGQSEKVELSYALVLYDNGTQNVEWQRHSNNVEKLIFNSDHIKIVPYGYRAGASTVSAVATGEYSTLNVEYKSKCSRSPGLRIGTQASTTGLPGTTNFVSQADALDSSETLKTLSCPITSGSFHVVLLGPYEDNSYGTNAYINIYKVWLE